MKKKILAGAAAVCAATCMAVTAFAASSTTFYVNGVRTVASLKVHNSGDYNPFDGDYVTATTTADASMDLITSQAILYYAWGSEADNVVEDFNSVRGEKTCSATARVDYNLYVGYKGEGTHVAAHNNDKKTVNTVTTW